jgi:aldose 1-epimerase
MNLTSKPFGETPDGTPVTLYTLSNDHGLEVSIINYGGAITSIKVPDRDGSIGDIVLGYETLAEYVKNPRYLGCLVGRHANRLGLGKFSLNGVAYQLAQNNGANHLHGGPKGFDKKVWAAEAKQSHDSVVLHLSYVSLDGEENYPGTLSVNVKYVVTNKNELRIEYGASTDKDTIVNLTNHSYFNLAGNGNILGHEVTINADNFTPVSKELIPTGEIRQVDGTPMDFRKTKTIGAQINEPFDQLGFTGGYDHNFVLNSNGASMKLAARAHEPTTGRIVEVFTTQPGMQFYSGNFLDGSLTGKGGTVYNKYAGFCLETQHFPDSPNHENFPSTVLRVGEVYDQVTVYKFSSS